MLQQLLRKLTGRSMWVYEEFSDAEVRITSIVSEQKMLIVDYYLSAYQPLAIFYIPSSKHYKWTRQKQRDQGDFYIFQLFAV